MRRVPPEIFRGYGDLVRQRVYVDRNPWIRWIFWERLRVLLALDDGVGRTVLDFGCGEGAMLPSLSSRHPAVVGVDLEVGAAARLVADLGLVNVRLLRAEGGSLPMGGECVDVVVAADVLEHFPDLSRPLDEIRRILRPNGVLLVSAPLEHLAYRMGRWVFGFPKPVDHYHKAVAVVAAVRRGFHSIEERRVPVNVPRAIAAFLVIKGRRA